MEIKRLTGAAIVVIVFTLLSFSAAYSQTPGVWISLDGVNDEIQVNDSDSLDGFSQVSWNMWVKQNKYIANAGLFGKYTASAGNRAYIIRTAHTDELSIILSSDGITYSTYTSGDSRNCGIRKTDGWIMLSITFNGSHLDFYRNGKKCDTVLASQGSINNSPVPLRVGGGNNVFFNGSIDDVKIYDSVLQIDQIKRLYDESEHGGDLGQSIAALLYHRVQSPASASTIVSPQNFEAQMAYLNASGFTTISTKDYYEWKNNNFSMPKRPIILFFDDGWKTVYTEALPIMEEYGFIGTNAIVADYANSITGSSYMNWSRIEELNDNGWYVVSHGRSHTNMLTLDETEFRKQLTMSRDNISEHLGITPNQFVFPFHSANQAYTNICGEYYELCWTWGVSTNNLKYLYKSTDGKLYKALIRISIINDTSIETFKSLLGKDTDLAAELRMDEGEGGIAFDTAREGEVSGSSGEGSNNGVLIGGALWNTSYVAPQCSDGADNDLDGSADYPLDFGCESVNDEDEANNGATQCSDGIDDDLDGFVDQFDLDCVDRSDDDEATPAPDLIPNVLFSANPLSGDAPLVVEFNCSTDDGDAPFVYNISFGDESFAEFNTSANFALANHTYSSAGNYSDGCNVTDIDGDFDLESLQMEVNMPLLVCSDDLDNDDDGFIDYPQDFGCESLSDDNEVNDGSTQCSDGLDNDLDSFVDQGDLDCVDRNDDLESTPIP